MPVSAGDTYLSDHGGNGRHLWVVVSDPLGLDNSFVVVNITSVYNTPGEDQTTIIRPNDHPFLYRDSRIAYRFARVVTQADYDSWV